jgi:hypothetical protein
MVPTETTTKPLSIITLAEYRRHSGKRTAVQQCSWWSLGYFRSLAYRGGVVRMWLVFSVKMLMLLTDCSHLDEL